MQLLYYFGEESDLTCGVCDVCLAQKRKKRRSELEIKLREGVVTTLSGGLSFSLEGLLSAVGVQADLFGVSLLRELEDEGIIVTAIDGKIKLNNQ
jgi:ATP-dependent DNA helicase RecQ